MNDAAIVAHGRETLRHALLNPKSVALVGASGNPKKNTARPLHFMRKHGFDGAILPVNPSTAQIDGIDTYPSIDALPDGVDHAFIMIDGARVTQAVEQCAARGIPVVTIYSDGFAEAGEAGQARQAELVDTARRLGVRLLGPNSIGVANIHSGAIVSVNAVFEMEQLRPGNISMISQSGSMMGSLLSRAAARGFGFAKTISVGNESDVSVGQLLDALVDDAATEVILLFLETLRDVDALSAALRRARQAGKPVIAYKLGRSEQGDALSQSHTGAIAGNDAAIDAYFRAHAVIRVNHLEALFEIAPLAARYAALRPQARPDHPVRVAVITTTGGGAATVVDNLGLHGLVAVAPPVEFIAHMEKRGLSLRQTPVIDLTLAASSEQYQDLLEQLLQTDWCDAVLSVAGSSAQFHPHYVVQPITNVMSGVHAGKKPLVVFLAPDAPASLQLLQDQQIAAFRTPESCADALAAFFSPQEAMVPVADELPVMPAGSPSTGNFTEPEAMRLFQALGLDVVQNQMLDSHTGEHRVPYPVVLKVISRDILHKTEAGGVCVGIASSDALEKAHQSMMNEIKRYAPEARIDGFMVQRMEGRLLELILGYRHDPLVGPTIMLGAGGVAAELNPDYSLRLAPVSRAQAWQMIDEVQQTKLVRGYRGLPEGDCEALADAIVAFSRLAQLPSLPVYEAEINPLFVQAEQVVAVDGVVRLHAGRTEQETNMENRTGV